MVGRIALTLLLATLAVGASAQRAPDPFPGEAPESLLELEIGDAEVDLFLSGGWTTGIAGGVGLSAYRNADGSIGTVFPSPFPGLETVPFFNRVDLTLSLWLLKRYFFETSVSDEFKLASLLFGYVGAPGEFVQSVLIGNSAIEMGAYPYLGFGDSSGVMGRETPGFSAQFGTERSSHEVMVRLEPSEERVISYSGGRIITEAHVDSARFIRDRFFVLPDGGLNTLTVYAESAGGPLLGSDGRDYRLVDLAAETVFSLAEGTLSFPEKPVGRIVVSYESGSGKVGDATLGTDSFFLLTEEKPDPTRPADFSFTDPEELLSVVGIDVDWATLSADEQAALETEYFLVTLEGKAGFLLYEPGRFSPFEVARVYNPPGDVQPGTTIRFTGPGGTELNLPLVATRNADGTLVSVAAAGAAAGVAARSYDRRYPFASPALANPTPEIYGPAPVPQASRARLTFSRSSDVDVIVLDGDYVPGSVRVQRNGTTTTAFDVSDGGEVTFVQPLTATDTVEVHYRAASSGESGDLLLGIGNRFTISPELDADVALGIRWKPIDSRYSTAAGQYPGYIALSASARYSGPTTFTARAAAGASYSVPDTTGVLRVDGMTGTPTVVAMSPRNIFPAAPPGNDPDPLDAITVDATTRGALFHADYTSAGLLGARDTQSYLWEPPASQVFAYADGGRIGPYSAVSNDAHYTGKVMVMEYDLAADRNWVAGLARINGGRNTDLSGATRIEGSFLATGGGAGVRVFMQIGALSEDLDGDEVVDRGTSSINPYLSFRVPSNDLATEWTLQAGAVNQSLDSPYTEDADGNGRSDPELPDLLFSRELPAISTDDGWQTFQIDLNRAEQRLLRSSRAVGFVVQRDAPDGERRTGRFVFSDLRFHGAGFVVSAPASAQVFAREIPESSALAPDDSGSLAAAFPAVAGRFETDGADPAVLAVRWSGLGAQSFTLSRTFSPIRATDYRELRLYLRGISTPGAEVKLRALTEVAGVVVESEPAVVSDEWVELIVTMPETGDGVVHEIEVEISGSDTGEILLDELSFWTPRDTFGATGSVEIAWNPTAELNIGGVTVVDAVTIRQSLQAQSAGYAHGLSASGTGIEATTDLGATIFGAPVEIGIAGSYRPTGPGLQAYHGFTIPITPARITLTELFRRSYLTYGESLRHDIALRVGPLGPTDLGVDWRLVRLPAQTETSWGADTALRFDSDGARDFAARLELTATETTSRELSPGTYPSDWAHSFTFVAPSGSEESARSVSLEAELKLGGSSADLEMKTVGETAVAADTDRLVASFVAEIGLPVSLGDRIRVTPRATRAITLQTRAGDSLSFPADVRAAAEVLGTQTYFITSWPAWELIDPGIVASFADATLGLDAAQYTPSVSVEISRPIRSSPWSLIVPTNARLSASRQFSREEDAVREVQVLTSEVSLTAPNVFGRLGISPLFGFYDTDEIITSVAGTLRNEENGRGSVEVDVDQVTRLHWLSGESLELITGVAGSFGARDSTAYGATAELDLRVSVDGNFGWTRPADRLEQFDRVAHLAAIASFNHTESIGLSGAWADTSSQRVTLKHSTRLTLPDLGSVSLYGGLGIGRSGQGASSIFLSGLQLGIEGQLRF